MKVANYIEGKVEEMRISGKSPAWIGLTLEVLTQLSAEFRPKMRIGHSDSSEKITKFLGLDVHPIEEVGAPKDGVYLPEVSK